MAVDGTLLARRCRYADETGEPDYKSDRARTMHEGLDTAGTQPVSRVQTITRSSSRRETRSARRHARCRRISREADMSPTARRSFVLAWATASQASLLT
jgi:hypothetical protein